MKTLEITENSQTNEGGLPTKLLIFQLLISQEYQTWYLIVAKTQSVYPVVQCK